MNRLFMRMLAWMLLALFAAVTGIFSATNLFYDYLFADPDWYPVRHTAALVQRIMNDTPAAGLSEEKDRLQELLGRDIDILPEGDPTPHAIRTLLGDDPVYVENFFYMQVHDGIILRLSPSFRQNKPILKPAAIFISCLVMAAVAVIVGFLLAYPVARRLRNLETAAEEISHGNMAPRVADSSRDLMGRMGRCFNQMADRIQLLIMARRDLIREVVEKFQVPIAEISRYLKELRGETKTEEIERRGREIDRAVNGIEHLVTDLLLNEKTRWGGKDAPSEPALSPDGPAARRRGRYGVSKFMGRMSLGILSVLLLHQLFMLGISQFAYDYLNTDPNWYPVRTVAALIGRVVEKAPGENPAALIASLREEFERGILLVPAQWGQTVPEGTLRKVDGGMTYGVYQGREVFRIPISEGSQCLLVDPAYALYRRKPSLLFHTFSFAFEFLLTAVCGILLSRPIIRDIKKLEQGIESIRKNEFGARVDIPVQSPTGALARCLNDMAGRIESLLDHQRLLIQAVAHEIRTPVSRLRFHIEMLGEMAPGEALTRVAADMETELGELELLVRELTTLSALETMPKAPPVSTVLLHQALSKITRAYRKRYPRIRIALSEEIPRSLSITVHPVFFKRAIQNILSNAVRHAEKSVHLSCVSLAGGVRIEIRDDGPGIPKKDRSTVFQPFTRLDDSRNRSSGGFGLGLAIVSRIVALHGGTVSIGDNGPRGTCVTTSWPGYKSLHSVTHLGQT